MWINKNEYQALTETLGAIQEACTSTTDPCMLLKYDEDYDCGIIVGIGHPYYDEIKELALNGLEE